MSSLGANYSGDTVPAADVVPAPTLETQAAPVAKGNSELNASPTCIVLDEPFTIGDLEPGVSYPHVYITILYLNGPALSMSVTYEIGTMANGWNPAPLVPAKILRVEGYDLVPFFLTKAHEPTEAEPSPYLWDQVETLMYRQIQASDTRCKGKIETVRALAPTDVEPST